MGIPTSVHKIQKSLWVITEPLTHGADCKVQTENIGTGEIKFET